MLLLALHKKLKDGTQCMVRRAYNVYTEDAPAYFGGKPLAGKLCEVYVVSKIIRNKSKADCLVYGMWFVFAHINYLRKMVCICRSLLI